MVCFGPGWKPRRQVFSHPNSFDTYLLLLVVLECRLLLCVLSMADTHRRRLLVGFSSLSFSDLERKNKNRNDPKFSDLPVPANSEDPDQTAPKGAV